MNAAARIQCAGYLCCMLCHDGVGVGDLEQRTHRLSQEMAHDPAKATALYTRPALLGLLCPA